MSIGIYKIECCINHKVYIGQSIKIEKRWKDHIFDLVNNKHCNTHLQNAWNKYGSNMFKFDIVELCSKNELNDKETYWKRYYDKVSGTYNIGHTGNIKTMSDEQKLKIKEYNLGKKQSKETIEKRRQKLLGHPCYTLGRKHTEEEKIKISESVKRTGKQKYWLGKKQSKDTNLKRSLKLKGKKKGPMSETTKAKLREYALNQKRDEHGHYC